MAKYIHLSRVYLSDEEFYELLSPKNVARRELLRLARKKGHIYSEKANEAEVRSKLAMLPSDWKTVSDVLQSIAKPDPEENKSARHICNCASDNDIEQIAKKVQEERGKANGEIYTVVKSGEKTVRMDVVYTEIDLSRAVPYQRRERTLSIEITKDGEAVHVLHNANDRAARIVDAFKALITHKPEAQLEDRQITLVGIRDAALRTKFFTQLITGLKGFKYQNATHLTVDRRLGEDQDDDETGSVAEEKKARKAAEVIKGMVHKVSLTGEQVMATELYQQAASTGYFISNISWSCVDEADARFFIECEAGFASPATAEKFSFDVTRKWRFAPDTSKGQEIVPLTHTERRVLIDLLEASAVNAQNAVLTEYKSHSQKANEHKPIAKPSS